MSDLIKRPARSSDEHRIFEQVRHQIAAPLGLTEAEVSRGLRHAQTSSSLIIDGKDPNGKDISIEIGMQGRLAINGQWSTVQTDGGTSPKFSRVYPAGATEEQRALFDRVDQLASQHLPSFRDRGPLLRAVSPMA